MRAAVAPSHHAPCGPPPRPHLSSSPPHPSSAVSLPFRCASGERGGSAALRAAVRRAPAKPRLWLCGHIHEARGAARARFGGRAERATLVVNAASANSGRARTLEHGATVVAYARSRAATAPAEPAPAAGWPRLAALGKRRRRRERRGAN